MPRTDAQLDRQIRRIDRRIAKSKRKNPGNTERVDRLTRKRTRLEAIKALPLDERPERLRIDAKLVRGALDAALLVLSATPAGPVLSGVKLGVSAIEQVQAAIRKQDVDDTIDGLTAVVRSELAARGLELDEDDETFATLMDALEDQLDRDA
jgi:hypothetical protein